MLVDIGGPWQVLPPGIHSAVLAEVRKVFATNIPRDLLFSGFARGFAALCAAGAKDVYLDGSFVTDTALPRDFDCCWEIAGVNPAKLDPVFLNFANMRAAQKQKYRGEFFPCTLEAAPSEFFLSYFQKDKYTGKPKGILRIES
jgi:hypothetical protein